MNNVAIFWLQLLTSLVVFAVVTKWYVWPRLTTLTLNAALISLLFVQVFRYVGMTLLVPGVVDPKLSREALVPGAYGDLVAAALALVAIFALRYNWRLAIPMVWVFSAWGFIDLLNTLRGVIQTSIPSFNLGTMYFVFIFYAPLVAIVHVVIFWVLIKAKSWNNGVNDGPRGVPEAKATR